MATNLGSRLKRAWNAFTNRDPPGKSSYGGGYSYRPDRVRLNRGNDRTILTAIYTRIAMDAASITINHVRLDENGRYDETVDSGLNSCLNLSGNKDQTGRALRYDLFLSVLDEGAVALVPVDVDTDPKTGDVTIESMRVGKIKEWYPDDVRLEVYNDRTAGGTDPAESAGGHHREPVLCCDERAEQHRSAAHPETEPDGRGG